MPLPLPATAPSRSAIDEIERGLTMVVRRANLPRSHDRLMSRANLSLDKAAYAVLARLDDMGTASLSELAANMGVDTSTASRQVRDLERAELVRRDEHPGDRRVAVLTLTPAGVTILARLRDARREAIAELLAAWDEEDREQLGRLLGRLADDLLHHPDIPRGTTT
jgi:DNA-binding MarR family transcriptional regulator